MTQLSVNVNKIATLRNARGGNVPNLIQAAKSIQTFGAQGITVHPRPDARHITYQDVRELKPIISTEFNIEGYPSREFLRLVLEVKPHQVTLVPDGPDVLTSCAGWQVKPNASLLEDILSELKNNGIRTSLFVSTDAAEIEGCARVGADRIELYTEPYAQAFHSHAAEAVIPFSKAATFAHGCGLGVNAGHDLDARNLRFFAQNVPYLEEVSIGHALIADALYDGLETTIQTYLNCLNETAE
ncbi:MAG: pyridoxine 5'-phosphate synthase [Bacteroidetes bacterium]|nr:pyridoxine 5'-phosphate synthase [Bacteroidota bacterium]